MVNLSTMEAATMMRGVLLAVLAFTVTGCEDKAKLDYDRCMKLSPVCACAAADPLCSCPPGNVQAAWDACTAAMHADENSRSGRLATQRLVELSPRMDKVKADEREADAKRDAVNLAALKKKIRSRVFSTQDDECTGKGLPPHAIRFTGGTYEEIAAVASSMGCGNPTPMSDVTSTWCCLSAQEL